MPQLLVLTDIHVESGNMNSGPPGCSIYIVEVMVRINVKGLQQQSISLVLLAVHHTEM